MMSTLAKGFAGIIGFILLSFAIESQAQSFKGGLVAGGTTSQIGGDDLSGFNKWGFFVGPSVSYPIKDNLDIKSQILFTQKGSKASTEELRKGRGLWEKITMRYFEVPFLAEYRVSEGLFLQGGFAPELLLSAELEKGDEVEDNFRSFSLSAVGGVRYELTDKIAAFSRLGFSVIPIDEGKVTINLARTRPNAASDFRNRVAHLVIKFGLGYSLGAL